MARPADHDQFVFDKVTENVAGTPAESHIANTPIGSLAAPTSASAPTLPPGLENHAPADALAHFNNAVDNIPDLPQEALDNGHLPGWLLGPI